MKKKLLCLLLVMAVALVAVYSIPCFAESEEKDCISDADEYVINEQLDRLIDSINDQVIQQLVFDYFYLPAYSKTEIYNSDAKAQSTFNNFVNSDISKNNYDKAIYLMSLPKEKLKKEIARLSIEGAKRIINMDNVVLSKEYVSYMSQYADEALMKKIMEKADTGAVFEIDPIVLEEKSSSKTKTFKKEYGNPDGAAYTVFKATVKWTYTSEKITSASTTRRSIVTPFYQQTFSAKKSTFIGSSKKNAYARHAWGYTNAFYGNGQVVGYYIIDVKVRLGTVKKSNLTTLSPAQYNIYSWG